MEIKFLGIPNPAGIFNSKAIGEPPLMYGIGVYFAIRNAISEYTGSNDFPYSAPITPEKVFMNLNLKKSVSQSS